MKRVVPLGVALALVAAALSIHLVTAGGMSARSGRVVVMPVHAVPRGDVVRGRTLGAGGRTAVLDVAASAPLLGSLGAVAVPSRDGAEVAYNTWQWVKPIDWQRSLGSQGLHTGDVLGTPTLRIRDLRTGADRSLEPGTFSAAWRADGVLAYVRGATADYLANTPYLRNVVVRPSADGAPVVWSTEPERYVVIGWAKRELIVAEQSPGGGTDLIAFSGPRQTRPLAMNADFVAVSPDGNAILVTESYADSAVPALREISAADGTEIARVPLARVVDPVTNAPITWIDGPGHWLGDRVVMPSSSGLIVVRASGSSLGVEQVIHVDSATQPNGRLWEPRFQDASARTIVTWSDLGGAEGGRSAQLVCDRYALTCTRGAAVPFAQAPRAVFDESGGE
jgi:hypothetical protein